MAGRLCQYRRLGVVATGGCTERGREGEKVRGRQFTVASGYGRDLWGRWRKEDRSRLTSITNATLGDTLLPPTHKHTRKYKYIHTHTYRPITASQGTPISDSSSFSFHALPSSRGMPVTCFNWMDNWTHESFLITYSIQKRVSRYTLFSSRAGRSRDSGF